jgi:hypothetical protein
LSQANCAALKATITVLGPTLAGPASFQQPAQGEPADLA